MKLVLTADATQRDKAGDGGTGIFFGQSFFPPLRWVLPFNGDTRSETESAILIVQVRPRRFDSLGIFTAVERFELTAFLALAGQMGIRFSRSGRFAATVGHTIKSGLSAPTADREVHRAVRLVDDNVGEGQR